MTNNTTTTPARATQSLAARVDAILRSHNDDIAKRDAEYEVECADEYESPTPPATLTDVLNCLSAANVTDNFGLKHGYFGQKEVMAVILDEIMKEIAGQDFDPWPELDKKELRFLVGNRSGDRNCPFLLSQTLQSSPEVPLTISEKVLAARHRKWLEKGAEAKRQRLKKAQSTIAELAGE